MAKPENIKCPHCGSDQFWHAEPRIVYNTVTIGEDGECEFMWWDDDAEIDNADFSEYMQIGCRFCDHEWKTIKDLIDEAKAKTTYQRRES